LSWPHCDNKFFPQPPPSYIILVILKYMCDLQGTAGESLNSYWRSRSHAFVFNYRMYSKEITKSKSQDRWNNISGEIIFSSFLRFISNPKSKYLKHNLRRISKSLFKDGERKSFCRLTTPRGKRNTPTTHGLGFRTKVSVPKNRRQKMKKRLEIRLHPTLPTPLVSVHISRSQVIADSVRISTKILHSTNRMKELRMKRVFCFQFS
jgi:hypothetical protein